MGCGGRLCGCGKGDALNDYWRNMIHDPFAHGGVKHCIQNDVTVISCTNVVDDQSISSLSFAYYRSQTTDRAELMRMM